MATYNGDDKRLQFLFDMVSNLASTYSNTETYAVGAYAIYQGVLYKCTTAVTTAEDFDPTKWTQVLVMNEISSGGGGGSVVSITPTLSSGTKIADYSINGVSGELYAPSGGGGSTPSFGAAVSESVTGLNAVGATHTFEHTGIACIYGRTSGSAQGYIYFTCAGIEYAMTTPGSWDTCLNIPVNSGDTLKITQLSARHSIVYIRIREFV